MWILNFLLFYTLNLIIMPTLKVYKQLYYLYMSTFNIIILFKLCGYWAFFTILCIQFNNNSYSKSIQETILFLHEHF